MATFAEALRSRVEDSPKKEKAVAFGEGLLLAAPNGNTPIKVDDTVGTFLPAREVANGIARLQGNPETRDQGIALQRRFQPSIPLAELQRVGLQPLEEKKTSFLGSTARGVLGAVLDIASRPQQTVMQGLRGGIQEGTTSAALAGMWGGLSGRGERADIFDLSTAPKGRRSVLGFKEGTTGGSVTSFLGEVFTDPLNLLSFGGSSVARGSLRAAAKEFGSETAEQVARRGFSALDDVQRARLTELVGGVAKMDRAEQSIRGGVGLTIPGLGTRTLVGGERFRAPLRSINALDEVRPGLRRGITPAVEAGTQRRTLQTAVRESVPAEKARTFFKVRADLATKYGQSVADDYGLLIGRAGASSALATEESSKIIDAAAAALDKSLKDMKTPEAYREVMGARLVRAVADNDIDGEIGRLLIEGHDEVAAALRAGGSVDSVLASLPEGDARDAIGRRVVGAFDGNAAPEEIARLRAEGRDEVADYMETLAGEVTSANRLLSNFGDGPFPTGRLGGISDTSLPRVATPAAQRAAKKQGASTREALREVVGGQGAAANRGGILKQNAEARKLEGLTHLENVLERDPGRLVLMQQVQANRAVALSDLADEMTKFVVDESTGQRLAFEGTGPVVEQRARDLGYRSYELGSRTIWAPPEVGPELARFNEVVFRNPTADKEFGSTFDSWLNLWKASATVPIVFGTGFHARNMTGNIFNNWLAGGIRPAHYKRAKQYQAAIKSAQEELVNITDLTPRVRPNLYPFEQPELTGFSRAVGPAEPVASAAPVLGTAVPSADEVAELSALRTQMGRKPTIDEWYGRKGQSFGDGRTSREAFTADQQARFRQLVAKEEGRIPRTGYDPETGERLFSQGPGGLVTDGPTKGQGQLFSFMESELPRADRVNVPPVQRTPIGDTPRFDEALRRVAKDHGLSEQDVENILIMRNQGVITSGYFKTDLHDDAVAAMGTSERRNYFQKILDNPQDAWLIRQGSDIGHYLETNGRMAHFLGKLDEGLSPEGAMLSVKKHLFDYSELTAFERNVLRRIMPFYTFMRKNTPLQFQNAVLQPRKVLGAARAQEAISNIGGDDEYLSGRSLPQYALDSGGTPLSRGMSEFLGGSGTGVILGVDLPSTAAFEVVEPYIQLAAVLPGMSRILPEAEDPSEAIRRVISLPGGGITEFFKVMVEHGTERDLFTGAPITDHGFTRLVADFARAASPFTGKAESTWQRVLSPGADGAERRARIATMILGFQLTVSDPRRERSEMFRRLDVIEREIEEAKNAGIDVPTLTELRESGLVPEL